MKKFFATIVMLLAAAAQAAQAAPPHEHWGPHPGGPAWHGGNFWHDGGWHRPHVDFDFVIGDPFLWGYWWGPRYYAYPPYYAYPDDDSVGGPVVYIQKDQAGSPAATVSRSQEYSYYCPDPAGYYPKVPACPKGWLRVVPDGSPNPAPLPEPAH